mgnify:FL=1
MDAKLQALKVPDLKNLLSTASLPVSGNKSDLIARLLENPAATASLNDGADAGAGAAVSAPGGAEKAGEEDSLAVDADKAGSNGASQAAAPAASAAGATSTNGASTGAASSAQPSESQAAPAPTDSERKAAALEELNKRLKRVQKFGGSPAEIEDLQKQIARIEKFGIPESDYADVGMKKLDDGLRAGGRRDGREPKKAAAATSAAAAAPAEPAKTETVSVGSGFYR